MLLLLQKIYKKKKLKDKVRHQPIGFELMPKEFTLSDIQNLYESVLGITLDKRNFRKKLLDNPDVSSFKKNEIKTFVQQERVRQMS